MFKKNIVIIGGGSASAVLIKEGFKGYKDRLNITVVASMADDGGSTGKLRRELNVSALGALRKCLLAMSEADEKLKNSFAHRFEKGELAGHVAGNIFMAALEKTTGSAEKALEIMHRILKIKGEVLPCSFDDFTLCAELENGKIIQGETNIDIPKHDGRLKIKKIFLRPKAGANSEAVKKIIGADLIIIGPGDLYTTILPNFLASGISDAVKKAKGKKVFAVNAVVKFGEANNFFVSDFAREAEKYIGGDVDFVLYNSRKIPPKIISRYKKEFAGKRSNVAGPVKIDKKLDKRKFIGKDLLAKNEPMLDAGKLAKALLIFK